MDEFVTEIQNNTKLPTPDRRKNCRFRELFGIILAGQAEIKSIENCDPEGDISFEVPMKSLGITYEVLSEYRDEISSEFVANFIGEILVRENKDRFVKLMTDLGGNYYDTVNKYAHRKFGMKVYKECFVLRFHVSLIQSLLTESFRKKIIL
jgi:hypothetical protein